MDASSPERTTENDEADVSQADDDIRNTRHIHETDVADAVSEELDAHAGVAVTDNSESIFKSPEQFAVPQSLSTQRRKNENPAPQKNKSENSSENTSQLIKNKTSEVLKQQVPIPYKEPEWSGSCDAEYSFDVLKNGIIIETVPLNTKPFHVFGRLPSCDITLEHPSLSRYHAVVQYSTGSTASHEKGWYVFDLDSTHGTWVNKRKIAPKVYQRLKVGYVVKFGGSTRLHILQGPSEDADDESEMTVTEMKEQRERQKKEAELLRQVEYQEEMQRQEAEQKLLEDKGCAWGMGEDAEDIPGENPFASLVPENESMYIDDPKKALKGFYEREGCDLPDYQFIEVGMGKHKCRLDLPVDGPNGEELVAEAVVTGKKKDAVVACALEACRILDKLGMLRASSHESRKRKQKKWEDDDFYDSDEDTFLDRTGTIEKKRSIRMKNAGKSETETYESLLEKYNNVATQIQEIESKLQKAKEEAEARDAVEMDELDAYMVSIKAGAMDTKTRIQLKGDLLRLRQEEQKLRKLVNIAKPVLAPSVKPIVTVPTSEATPTADSLSRKLHAQHKQHKKAATVRVQTAIELKPDSYEEQEEENEGDAEQGHSKHESNGEHHQKSANTSIASRSQSGTNFAAREEKANESHTNDLPSSRPKVIGAAAQPLHSQPQTEDTHRKQFKSPHQLSTMSVLNTFDKKQQSQKRNEKSGTDSSLDNTDPNYAMWLPPEEQSGDGRTSLNDKLGY